MQTVLDIVLRSGESVVNLVLFTLLPIMTVMMSLMRLLEDRGIIRAIALLLSAPLMLFGLPGIAALAMLQLSFVSYAAPAATLRMIDSDSSISSRRLSATFAMLLPMSQANALFPLTAVGLNAGFTLFTSVCAGLLAAGLSFYIFNRTDDNHNEAKPEEKISELKKPGILTSLTAGGQEGMHMVFRATPLLLLSLILVNSLREIGVIAWLSTVLNAPLSVIGIPGVAVLPIITKFIAGGTAMMGITMELMVEQVLSVQELNRIAGLIVNPMDIIGVAFLMTAGERTRAVAKPALLAGGTALLIRAIVHILVFS